MTWKPNKNGDVYHEDSIKKIVETDPTGPAKKVRIKSTPSKVSVPFFKIQSPLFEKSEGYEVEVGEDKVNLPPHVRTSDFELFKKEAQLTGWEVRKLSRNKVDIEVDDNCTGHYVRRGKRWRLDKVTRREGGLEAYKTPLTKIVERNSVRDLEHMMDYTFTKHIEEALDNK